MKPSDLYFIVSNELGYSHFSFVEKSYYDEHGHCDDGMNDNDVNDLLPKTDRYFFSNCMESTWDFCDRETKDEYGYPVGDGNVEVGRKMLLDAGFEEREPGW